MSCDQIPHGLIWYKYEIWKNVLKTDIVIYGEKSSF